MGPLLLHSFSFIIGSHSNIRYCVSYAIKEVQLTVEYDKYWSNDSQKVCSSERISASSYRFMSHQVLTYIEQVQLISLDDNLIPKVLFQEQMKNFPRSLGCCSTKRPLLIKFSNQNVV
jgi:hypothetical protein